MVKEGGIGSDFWYEPVDRAAMLFSISRSEPERSGEEIEEETEAEESLIDRFKRPEAVFSMSTGCWTDGFLIMAK